MKPNCESAHRADQHHSFDAEIHYARALPKHLAHQSASNKGVPLTRRRTRWLRQEQSMLELVDWEGLRGGWGSRSSAFSSVIY